MRSRFRRLMPVVRPHLPLVVLSGFLVSIEALLALLAPRLTGFAVDGVVGEEAWAAERLTGLVMLLLAVFAGRALLNWLHLYFTRLSGNRMLRDLRQTTFDHLLGLSPDFFDERRVGELLSRLSSDLEQVRQTLSQEIPGGVRAILMFVGTLAVLLSMHLGLTLLALAVVPPIVALAGWYGRRLQKLALSLQDSRAHLSADAEEILSGIQTVQAFGGETVERQRYRSLLASVFGYEVAHARVIAGFSSVLLFVGSAAFAGMLWYGGHLILAHAITPGDLTAFLLYALAIGGAVSSLGSLYASLRQLGGASRRVVEILERAPTISSPHVPKNPAVVAGVVSYKNVSYIYPTRTVPAVVDVSFEVNAGETVALVGPSGAGKTTLLSLLIRFRDPMVGTVALDGIDVRELGLPFLRSRLSLVSQDVFLFDGTIADNIRYSRPEADDDEVRGAAILANADGFIRELESGYQTRIGERGARLSAGQRQRIAIARAFLRDPKILLLDEATSALDADSEAHIHDALARLSARRTTLVIAHRLSTARRAQKIAVLDHGHLVGFGPHDTLYESSELYRRYWDLQR
jgi:subfamily B ATP-binding cassette protein MsbA